MTDHHDYLAVLKASYDYQPQSDDELAVSENQILLLLERVDDECVHRCLFQSPCLTQPQLVEGPSQIRLRRWRTCVWPCSGSLRRAR